MTIDQIVQDWNDERRARKDEWFSFHAKTDDGAPVAIKSWNTWMQIVRIGENGAPGFTRGSGPMDARVRDAQDFLRGFLAQGSKRWAQATGEKR